MKDKIILCLLSVVIISSIGCLKKTMPITIKGQIIDTVTNNAISYSTLYFNITRESGTLPNHSTYISSDTFTTDQTGKFSISSVGQKGATFFISFKPAEDLIPASLDIYDYLPDSVYITKRQVSKARKYNLGVIKTHKP